METPIYTRLEAYHRKNRISFAMPGHKNLRALAPDLQKCDVTELAATVDLHHECDTVKAARRLLTELYGTRESFILTGGSTAGIQAMLASVLKPGDVLLTAADCHMSVVNTCALCGFRLKLIPTEQNAEFLVPAGLPDFEITPEIGAVLVTSPNYYGITKDIKALAEKCHKAGVPLIVDEAHGAHFIASDQLPVSAVSCGADMVCHSAHKTLNALTGAAYLHICSERIQIDRVKRALRAFQTSSPSYPIAASADIARATLTETRYDGIINECRQFAAAISRAAKVRVLENDDPTRLVLSFAAYDVSGFAVAAALSAHFGIDVEMADMLNIVLIVTPWNTHRDFMRLFDALRDILAMHGERQRIECVPQPPVTDAVISPSDGWFADTERIGLEAACGRIAAESVTAYPPGTAVIVTGERIRQEQLSYIAMLAGNGAEIAGMQDNKIEVVR